MTTNSDFMTEIEGNTALQNALMEEQKQFPLVGPQHSLAPGCPLFTEVTGNETFMQKCRWISTDASVKLPPNSASFTAYRPVRRDGSCFYRSALFQLFYIVALEVNGALPSPAPAQQQRVQGPKSMATALRFLLSLGQWKAKLKVHFGEFSEDFVDVTEEMVKKVMAIQLPFPSAAENAEAVREWKRQIGDEVTALLADEHNNTFEFIVCLARYGVSAFLRDHAALFAPFVAHIIDMGDDELSIQTYCEREVDVVGGECDEVHLLAFSAFFKVDLAVWLIDNNEEPSQFIEKGHAVMPCQLKKITFVDTLRGLCGEDVADNSGMTSLGPYAKVPLNLLYRPGHYEILIQ